MTTQADKLVFNHYLKTKTDPDTLIGTFEDDDGPYEVVTAWDLDHPSPFIEEFLQDIKIINHQVDIETPHKQLKKG